MRNSTFDLSVITVCRNVKDSIAKTVQSVMEQKGKATISIEHIYVDGASSDGTPELLERLLGEGKIEQYVSEPDTGIYDAMNKGIRLARGKVLFFLNSDDELLEEADLAQLVRPIVAGECDATCGRWYSSDKPDTLCEAMYHLRFTVTPCCHQAYFMSKQWYEKLRGYDADSFRCLADADVMWSAFSAGARIECIPTPVIMFNLGGLSTYCHEQFLDEAVSITLRHKDAMAEHMRKNREYARFMAQYLATHILLYPAYLQRGGKHPHETAAALRALCQAANRAAGGLANRCILKLLSGPCLRAFQAGKTGRLRQLLWRIPCLFLAEPTAPEYTIGCWPLSLKARLFGR